MRRRVVALTVSAAALAAATTACAGTAADAERAAGRPPAAGGYFEVSPVRAALPRERRCARLVRRSRWEPRPSNYHANHSTPRALRLSPVPHFDRRWNARYRTRITGAFVGTTDEIIQWAACKWGLSDELLRAQAVVESEWRQSAKGDLEPRSDGNCTVHDRGDPCPTSFGLLQTKWYFNRAGYPLLRTMTPFHMDWSAAQLRGCYDGRKAGVPGGDVSRCLGNWFSGGVGDELARDYLARVRVELAARRWLSWPDGGGTVPYSTGPRSP